MSNSTETPMDTLANLLYGATSPAPAVTPQGAPAPATPPVPVDRKFFGDWQPSPLPAGASLDQRMYRTPHGILPALKEHNDTMRDTLGFTQAEVETFSRDHAEALQEAGLSASLFGPDIVAAGVQARVAQRSGGAEPDPARLRQQEENFRREYRVMLGPERAERLFDEVAQFMSDHPRLLRLLQQPGFVGAPSAEGFMRKLAEHVRRLRM